MPRNGVASILIGLCVLGFQGWVHGSDWKAGVARVEITPQKPVWMAGYASRTKPSEGTLAPLHAKALAIEDAGGYTVVVVTLDVLGFPAEVVEDVATEASQKTGLPRSRMLFNASHTHSGPALSDVLRVAYAMTGSQYQDVMDYTAWLKRQLVDVIQEALVHRQPVRLAFGTTASGFAVNRRVAGTDGYRIGVNRLGPVDDTVRFLAVDSEAGKPLAVLFGYSCHCTTLQGDNYRFHPDYAGVAQSALEESIPEAMALFLNGTGGDTNPNPRGTLALAEKHGQSLAAAVLDSLNGPLHPVTGKLRADFVRTELDFESVPSEQELRDRLGSSNPYIRNHAQRHLDLLQRSGRIPSSMAYPIQAFKFGDSLTIVGLGGEVVLDYGIRLRREHAGENLWVAGYSNDVSSYIPSRRILDEGGYEAVDSMIYYGKPSAFATTVEERIIGAVSRLLSDLRKAK